MLGNFDNATFHYAGITSTFSKRNGKFFVNTDGPDGKLADYEIKFAFRLTPHRISRWPYAGSVHRLGHPPERERRAALVPRLPERITYENQLHWTGPQQNWNFMCADCHSTNLKEHYDATTHTFKTTWSEVNVSCEACHGPGSRHVEWAQRDARALKKTDATKGLTVSFRERRAVAWSMDAQRGIARPKEARPLQAELESCAPCHARRTPIADGFAAGKPFFDHYLPALLQLPFYHVCRFNEDADVIIITVYALTEDL